MSMKRRRTRELWRIRAQHEPHALGCANMPHGPHMVPSTFPFIFITYICSKYFYVMFTWWRMSRHVAPDRGWLNQPAAYLLPWDNRNNHLRVGPSHPPGPSRVCQAFDLCDPIRVPHPRQALLQYNCKWFWQFRCQSTQLILLTDRTSHTQALSSRKIH